MCLQFLKAMVCLFRMLGIFNAIICYFGLTLCALHQMRGDYTTKEMLLSVHWQLYAKATGGKVTWKFSYMCCIEEYFLFWEEAVMFENGLYPAIVEHLSLMFSVLRILIHSCIVCIPCFLALE